MNKKILIKSLSLLLAGGLLTTGLGLAALPNPDGGKNAGNGMEDAAGTAQSLPAEKDETVYILAGADGAVRKIIVSDWLKNAQKQNVLVDPGDPGALTGLTNVKGDEGYSLNPDNMRVWDAAGGDIYYQGEAQKELPVDISIHYLLDGQPISAEELAGKSGQVTIRFLYQNHQKQTVEILGEPTDIYVPFVMLTGLTMDNDHFRNITVSNGRVISDGSRSIVVGFAFPGMQESLGLTSDQLDIPSHVEITADATDFSLSATMSVASGSLFSELDPDRIDDTVSMEEALKQLESAAQELADGSSVLYDGLSTLLTRSGELIAGIDQLAAGAKELTNGASRLQTGVSAIQCGAGELAGGLNQLAQNSAALNQGADTLFQTLLAAANTQLAASGLQVPPLHMDTYAEALDQVLASLSEETVRAAADATAREKVTAAVTAQEDTIRTQVRTAVRFQVLEEVLKAAGQSLTAEQYTQAVQAGLIPPQQQRQIEAAVDAQMASEAIGSQVEAAVEQQIQLLIEQSLNSEEVRSQIEAALQQAAAGRESIRALRAQLDSYREFHASLKAYTGGVDQANAGGEQLKAGTAELAAGAGELSSGAEQLLDGVRELQQGGAALISGEKELQNGAMQLSEGMAEFQRSGIQKLTTLCRDDLGGLAERFRALVNASRSCTAYTGGEGSVRFVYKTDGIG
ncbi:MAG: hypothetical protein HFJ80_01110 [Clostridiales bacterium]|nr:hypothetical protein [Clostridiales bacterium]